VSFTPAGAVLLARHGETKDNRHARFQGQTDTPLSDAGREQAGALAERVADAGIAALYSSGLSRAIETAAIVGERLGVEVVIDPRLNEVGMGLWQGRRKADVEREEPQRWAAWRRYGAVRCPLSWSATAAAYGAPWPPPARGACSPTTTSSRATHPSSSSPRRRPWRR
jgi:broad specificity phosphatase PhoE